VNITGTLGAKDAEVSSVTVESGARLYGKTKIRLLNPTDFMEKPGSYVVAGGPRSPGVLEIDGGGVQLAALSGFGWEFDGPKAGNGAGFHSLLDVPDATVTLLSNAGQEPILVVDELGLTALPVDGQTYDVIDIDPDISRVTGDFMTAAGLDLSEGTKFVDDQGFDWQISYHGGPDGNDVVLTSLGRTSVPEPGTLTIVLPGLLAWWAAKASSARRRGGKQAANE